MQANRCLYWELKQINCTTSVFNQTGTEKNDTPLDKAIIHLQYIYI